ncbi:Gamma-aminobutyric acid receptor alpha-like [Portunus trituberculatus]|uniref:Gamma-aminobutyric acid receptor alpha-like n=1 Tax=Portunus trituberculatus TaxID=210409 RepID=A0A5B7KAF3_PORTR|nr:Gamma-aminobutyric acid receptor alpha-like [Portunus trituberculatus]
MTFLGLEARTDLPKVPYSTALDLFVWISYGFIFATIIEVRSALTQCPGWCLKFVLSSGELIMRIQLRESSQLSLGPVLSPYITQFMQKQKHYIVSLV